MSRDASAGAPEARRVWDLAWPMIVSNVSVPLLGMVDTAVLGHLPDARYLAAVAVGTTIFGFLYWGFGFLRMGSTGLVAQALGAAPGPARGRALRALLWRTALLAVVLALVVLAAAPIAFAAGFAALAPPPEVLAEARAYCAVRIASAPAVLVTYGLLGFLVGMQDTRSVLVVMVTTNVANIVLDLVLVLGFDLRTAGVAGATVGAEYLGLLVALAAVRRRLRDEPGRLGRGDLADRAGYRRLLAVNGHLFLRTLVLLSAMAFFTARGARAGEVVLAANAVLLNLLMLVSFALDGFAHAAEARVGRAVGGGRGDAVAATIRACARFSGAAALAFTAAFAVGAPALVSLLTGLDAVAATARAHLGWIVALPLVAMPAFLLDGVFIGAARTRAMRDTMLVAFLGVYLPSFWLARPLGNHGLWLAFELFFLARGAGLGLVLAREARSGRWFVPGPGARSQADPSPEPRRAGLG